MPEHETCRFCALAASGPLTSTVWEDDTLLAFLDINPIRPGHIQLMPKAHFPFFDDLPPDLGARFFTAGQWLARGLKDALGVKRVGFVCTGGDVAHAHAHVVPLHAKTDITSLRYFEAAGLQLAQRPRPDREELETLAASLRPVFAG